MPDLFFEDVIAGAALPEATLAVGADDAGFFAAAFGPGAAALGDEDGSAPLSGWHVAVFGIRLVFDTFLHRTAGLRASRR